MRFLFLLTLFNQETNRNQGNPETEKMKMYLEFMGSLGVWITPIFLFAFFSVRWVNWGSRKSVMCITTRSQAIADLGSAGFLLASILMIRITYCMSPRPFTVRLVDGLMTIIILTCPLVGLRILCDR